MTRIHSLRIHVPRWGYASLLAIFMTASAAAQLGGTAGAFTRLGFGARAQGMGNAMTAVNTGIISALYNPALTPFQTGHVLYGNYSLLSLDRKFNQVSYTQNFILRKKGANKYSFDPDVLSVAGVSAGWTNAGDATVQGYDNDGFKTGMLSVFENQFFLNFGTRFTERLSAGFNAKFYYSGFHGKLSSSSAVESVTSSGFGGDVGILYQVTKNLNAGLVIQELLTKYKWDTSLLYGPESGNATDDPFARVIRAGLAYTNDTRSDVASADVEMYGSDAILARVGAEYAIVEQFAVRAGVERIALKGKHIDPRPSAGFTFTQPVAQFQPSFTYAFIYEPVAPLPTHVLSCTVSF
jgi:hypothetical protein